MSQIKEAFEGKATLVELRLDLLREEPAKLYPLIPDDMKTIATCRPGTYDQAERLRLLSGCLEFGTSYLDIEVETTGEQWDDLIARAKSQGTQVIISYHDYKGTPDRTKLVRQYEECLERGGDLVKIATLTDTDKEVRELLSLHELPGRKVILGMGEKGRITRVAGPYLGSEFTFAAPGRGSETAPGQLTRDELVEIYQLINAT